MPRLHSYTILTLLFLLATIWTFCDPGITPQPSAQSDSIEQDALLSRAAQNAALCNGIRDARSQPHGFNNRDGSGRWLDPDPKNSKAYLIVNAIIWIDNSTTSGDILLERGIIKEIGNLTDKFAANTVTIIDADGSFATPGLVLLHSHAGLQPSPLLQGSNDLNSKKGPVVPWLRALDAFHVHDEILERYIAQGVTTVQVSPGDFNAIGGQSYMMKLRSLSQRTPSSMLVEPLDSTNDFSPKRPPKRPWQYLTQTCGEKLRLYGNTRMDTAWSIRKAYHRAQQVMHAQDLYCSGLNLDGDFPNDFDLEVLVDVLRGKVKVSSVCHEVSDLDFLTRLSNEFKIPLAHVHSSEAWLAPHLINASFGEPPIVALTSSSYRTNGETFRGSEFAPRVLIDSGIQVAMTADHSTSLIHEARLAHYYGLPPAAAITAITSMPAKAVGLDYRLGYLRPGFDGDIVLWSHHPLSLQAVPTHVWVDGDLVFRKRSGHNEHQVKKRSDKTKLPTVPNWDNERIVSLARHGLPQLRGRRVSGRVAVLNVKEMWVRHNGRVSHDPRLRDTGGTVLIEDGKIICVGQCYTSDHDTEEIDLRGGSISPGLMAVGSTIGLEELATEPSTGDGRLYTPFSRDVPKILGDAGGVVRAVDALQFQTRNALYAFRSGVTLATTAPGYAPRDDIITGLSATFRTGGGNALEHGSIMQDISALHISIGRSHTDRGNEASVSSQIAALRRLLSGWQEGETETEIWFRKARKGIIPLVINVDSADIMSALLRLKIEIEEQYGTRMRMVFQSAKEAHLIAKDIGKLGVGVILESPRKMPQTWDERRGLASSPTNDKTDLDILMENRVTVGIGQSEAWEASNLRFDIGWMNTTSSLSVTEAYELVSINLEKLLGIRTMEEEDIDLVLTSGGNIFEQSAKVVAIVSMGSVTIF